MSVLDLRILVSRLEPRARRALEGAVARAASRGHGVVEVEHWLAELVESDPDFQELLAVLDVSGRRMANELSHAMERLKPDAGGAPALSPRLIEWIEEAWLAASLRFGRNAICHADLLVAITTNAGVGAYVRRAAPSLQLDEARVIAQAAAALAPDLRDGAAAVRADGKGGNLAAFAIDLTAEARAGRIDPVIGREAELRQVIDILVRRRQNNPILTGEAGVGKTAVVEALAQRVSVGEVPAPLRGVEIHALDLGLLQAGAGVKGEFERRLKGVIDDIKN